MSNDPIIDVWRQHRVYLLAVARGLLRRVEDAEEVVQDAFARLAVQPVGEIEDVRAWMVVVVRRLALDRLESAHHRLTEPTDVIPETGPSADPADRVTMDDEVRRALSVVLDRLSPAERTAFVLHDIFGLPFKRVSELTGRTPEASRQLASRARRSVRIGDEPGAYRTSPHLVQVAEQFVAACATGDMKALTKVLAPDAWGAAPAYGRERIVIGGDPVSRGVMHFLGPRRDLQLSVLPLGEEVAVLATREAQPVAVIRLQVDGNQVQALRALPLTDQHA